ncbi:MAG: hypothetical protein IJB22_05400 [Clostridia bacterium]|nr:hypothetical protein [Clostridia bacterium]
MTNTVYSILQDFCLTPSPSGFEKEIAEKFYRYIEPYCDSVEVDPLGNVIGTIKGQDPSLKPVMINSHMDRIGFIVSTIAENGFLRMRAIGSPNEKVLPGLTLSVRRKDHSEWVKVAVGTKCAHLLTAEEAAKAPTLRDVMLDPGVDSADEVRALGIDIGCPAVMTPSFAPLAGSRVCGTALDNCGTLAALVDAARQLSEERPLRTVYICANGFEEYNQRASAAIVRRFRPIAAISMDMLLAGDTPDVKGEFEADLGGGPVVSCYNYSSNSDIGCIAHEGLLAIAGEAAAAKNIAIQRYVCGGCGDNAYASMEADGPAAIEIGAAVRYAHSSCEMADLRDIEQLGVLIAEMARRIDGAFRQERYTF